jgi:two-component system sensor histidine kinase AlgZ
MLDRLSTLLRATLDAGDRQEITLADELALLRGYLDIQQTRFGERLSVSIDVPDGCLSVRVPCLLLQPIVENAIHHGIAPRASGGAIRVIASLAGGSLILTVEDDGPGPRSARAEGIGLSNTRTRLTALYPRASAVELRPRPGGGTIVAITIPARVTAGEPGAP